MISLLFGETLIDAFFHLIAHRRLAIGVVGDSVSSRSVPALVVSLCNLRQQTTRHSGIFSKKPKPTLGKIPFKIRQNEGKNHNEFMFKTSNVPLCGGDNAYEATSETRAPGSEPGLGT